MSGRTGGRPASVLAEGTTRTVGEEALSMNLAAGQAVGLAVRTTLGPDGMDKMLVDESGNVLVTNDGVTMLEEMDIEHPAADLVVDVARTQEAGVGDGTTSAVVLAGALLEEAEDLLDDGIHPTDVIEGYNQARRMAGGTLQSLGRPIDASDHEALRQVAATALTGKTADQHRELLADVVVDAFTTVVEDVGHLDRDLVRVRTFHGQAMGDSTFLEAVTLGQRPPHPIMPESFDDAAVLVYEGAIEPGEFGLDVTTRPNNPANATALLKARNDALGSQVDTILDHDVDVVIAADGIEDSAQGRFADAGTLAFRRVDDVERKRIAQATGATRIGDLETMTSDHLGRAERVYRRRVRPTRYAGDARPERVFQFEGGGGGGVGTIWLRAGTDQVVSEVERGVGDALDVLERAVADGRILPGAGATEIELAAQTREAAAGVSGRAQLAVEAFADAIETLPRTIATTAGHDPIDALVALSERHDAGEWTAGFDTETGEVVDAKEAGVIEPLSVKLTAIENAVSAATILLRIDDVVAAGDLAVADDD